MNFLSPYVEATSVKKGEENHQDEKSSARLISFCFAAYGKCVQSEKLVKLSGRLIKMENFRTKTLGKM